MVCSLCLWFTRNYLFVSSWCLSIKLECPCMLASQWDILIKEQRKGVSIYDKRSNIKHMIILACLWDNMSFILTCDSAEHFSCEQHALKSWVHAMWEACYLTSSSTWARPCPHGGQTDVRAKGWFGTSLKVNTTGFLSNWIRTQWKEVFKAQIWG